MGGGERPGGDGGRSENLVLSDLLLGDDGLVPFGRTDVTHALMGRFGNVFLVNGAVRPRITARRGEVIRFQFTNAANARTFNLSFPGARMKLIGSDAGHYEREAWVESVVIAPAERYIVDVQFTRPGTVVLANRVRGLDHFFNRFFFESDTLARSAGVGHGRRAGCGCTGRPIRHCATRRRGRGRDRPVSPLLRQAAGPHPRAHDGGARASVRHADAHAARLVVLRAGRMERDDAGDELGSDDRAGPVGAA